MLPQINSPVTNTRSSHGWLPIEQWFINKYHRIYRYFTSFREHSRG